MGGLEVGVERVEHGDDQHPTGDRGRSQVDLSEPLVAADGQAADGLAMPRAAGKVSGGSRGGERRGGGPRGGGSG
jgi:hypothetical protein